MALTSALRGLNRKALTLSHAAHRPSGTLPYGQAGWGWGGQSCTWPAGQPLSQPFLLLRALPGPHLSLWEWEGDCRERQMGCTTYGSSQECFFSLTLLSLSFPNCKSEATPPTQSCCEAHTSSRLQTCLGTWAGGGRKALLCFAGAVELGSLRPRDDQCRAPLWEKTRFRQERWVA